jgi:NAD-dependent dihydropyrimidine dehydrogenase PreA subunit
MAFVICEPCVDVKDTACVKVCPVDCIYDFDGERQLYIHPVECIDCGACQPECPVQAIFPLSDVPGQWSSYIEKNAKIFETHTIAPKIASGDAAEATPETRGGSDGVASPVSSADVAALQRLLRDVAARTITANDALEQTVSALGKLGVRVV